jgi:IS30 family transposase
MNNIKIADEQKKYTHITKQERQEISILINKGYSYRDIAQVLKRSTSSIFNEIKHNSVNGIYNSNKAHQKSYIKRKHSKYQGMKIRENSELEKYISEKLKKRWSPEVIAGRLKEVDKHFQYASKGAIYKFIDSVFGQYLQKYLYKNTVHKRKDRKRRKKEDRLKDRIFIDQRPKYIDNRLNFGHWEGDFIVSGKHGPSPKNYTLCLI